MKKLNFFLDIDDTLLPSQKNKISSENIEAIKKARSLGSAFFINTGRPLSDIQEEILCSECFDGILCGGDLVLYRGKTIYSSFLPKEDAISLFTALMSMDKEIDFNLGGVRNRYYIGEKKAHYRDGIYLPVRSIGELDTVFDGDSLQKYSLYPDKSTDTEAIKRELERHFSIIEHPTYTEGFLHGHDKAFLIKKAEDILGLKHETTVAIGDSLNDTQMLEYAAISVAMGNAPDVLKEKCTFVTDTSLNNGVAKAIKMLAEEK